MVKAFLLASALTAMASAAGLSLTIGPPVAAGPGVKYVKKTAALFAVRLEDCADPLSAQISATGLHAGRLANGDRPSVAMQVVPAGTPGVYLVSEARPVIIEGGRANFAFVVGISATCGGERAGAIVPLLSQRFEREFIKFFPVAPSSAEIQQALSDAEKRAIVIP